MTARNLRLAFWTLAVLLGGAQTWYTRHRMFSDGISYLEIAREYANGNWHAALNAYWSPLYSWVVAVYLVVFKPGPYWDVSSLHVVNFVMFLASCCIFDKFLMALVSIRPEGLTGFREKTLMITGYLAILHGGLLMVGIGYVSPDMIAYFLTGLAAWLTLRIARGRSQALDFAALGVTLGLGYLDRTAFLPLSVIYVLAAAALLVKIRRHAIRDVILCGTCMLAAGAPFAIALTMQKGAFSIGESGKLNYAWEVDGAARSAHWQGEPGDIGTPLHPTRLIMKSPVPVYEFAQPVPGSYPPWRDPSYWYAGIQPHLKVKEQLFVLGLNLRTTILLLATTPAFVICFLALILSKGKGLVPFRAMPIYWVLMLPAGAGIAMYCLVFIDKRYIAGFFTVFWLTVLAGLTIPEGSLAKYADFGAQAISALFLISVLVWIRPAVTMSIRDLARMSESEYNAGWEMAHRYETLGLKPGDRIACVGACISADWVRIANAQVIAEVPVRWVRGKAMLNMVEARDDYPAQFFELDEQSREKVYDTFRAAGAIMAVTNRIPRGEPRGDWKPLLDPNEPRYPKAGGQMMDQAPGFYRWLTK